MKRLKLIWRYLTVALRKESVDRNDIRYTTSTRPSIVALRKESVDRNNSRIARRRSSVTSLSARRAWIEIPIVPVELTTLVVALRKESVDRNPPVDTSSVNVSGRSPQGERG